MNDRPIQEEEGSSPFDLKVLVLYGLFRSKMLVLVLTGIGASIGLFMGASQPNEYQSEARLRYVPGERDKLTDDELAGIENADRRHAAPGLTDEIMLLENPIIYERVAKKLGPSYVLELPDPEAFDGPNTPLPSRWLHKLQKTLIHMRAKDIDDNSPKAQIGAWRKLQANTTLATVRNASTIRVLVRAYSPEKAQQFCGELVTGFQERHREVFSAEARLDDQRRKVSEALEKFQELENRYTAYREECGVYNYQEERDANQRAREEIEKEIDLAHRDRRRITEKIKAYQDRLKITKQMVFEITAPVMGPNPEYKLYADSILAAEQELVRLVDGSMSATQLEHARSQAQKRKDTALAQLEKVDKVIEVFPERKERVQNPEFADLQVAMTELISERNGIISDIEFLEEKKEALTAERELIAECKNTHSQHQDRIESAKDDLDRHQDQLLKLEKLADAEAAGASALKPLWDPTLPLSKVGPSRLKPLLAGIAAGLFLGLALAILRQLLDRRLRYPETLERSFGLRVLGVVPEVRRLRGLRKGTKAQNAA